MSKESFNLAPRYDIPNAAPEPLRQVQLLINSVDLTHGIDWIDDWLKERGLAGRSLALKRRGAVALRETLRTLVQANNGRPLEPRRVQAFNRAARRLTIGVDRKGALEVTTAGDPLDEVVAIAVCSMIDGSWSRLKACRNCRWCFYDKSPNRSASWCSMKICGNRAKVREYRRRQRAGAR